MKTLPTFSNKLAARAVAQAAIVGCVALLVLPAAVYAEDTPLSLTLSQNLRHESNLSRSTKAQSDTVSTTAVQGSINKAYGRQTYSASARFARARYNQFSNLDNDAKDVNLGMSSTFASNWSASLNGSTTSGINAPENNPVANRLLRNIRHYRDIGGSVQYGNGGTWAVVGTFDNNRLTYSESLSDYQNSEQSSQGARLVYNASDLLSFGLGPRWVHTRYPQNPAAGDTKDTNLDFTVNWQVTGLSGLNLLLSQRQSEVGQSGRRVNATTGSLGWGYTPRGRISYGVNLTRATSADRFQDASLSQGNFRALQSVAQDSVNTSLNLSASAPLTGKVSTSLSYGLTFYEQNNSNTLALNGVTVSSPSSNSSSRLQSLGWNTNYAAYRWLGMNCSVQFYNQTADVSRPKYNGHSLGCGASLTLDP